jgi:A118 family predicted phage portal protein
MEDFELGGKIVFVPDNMLRHDPRITDPATGRPAVIPPQREKKNLFIAVEGTNGTNAAAQGITEHNPDLRVTDNQVGINQALSMLSSSVGMGEERYTLRNSTIATATQVISENSDLFRTRRKHLLSVSSMLTTLARAVLWCHAKILGDDCDSEADIVVSGDDSVIEDDGTRIARGLQLFQANAISQYTFLTTYIGMTDEDATSEVERIKDATTVAPLFGSSDANA